jgi:hypothetical protein
MDHDRPVIAKGLGGGTRGVVQGSLEGVARGQGEEGGRQEDVVDARAAKGLGEAGRGRVVSGEPLILGSNEGGVLKFVLGGRGIEIFENLDNAGYRDAIFGVTGDSVVIVEISEKNKILGRGAFRLQNFADDGGLGLSLAASVWLGKY